MPSAANVKIDKQINSDNALVPDSSGNAATPMRQAITVIEHKIRNLEKRKAKLESYRELQNSGKELNHDQKIAVAKYEEVVQTLDFARDLCKQFLGIATVSEKDAKKQARKEAAAKSQAELAKIREVLLVQDALNQMGPDNIREDFLEGRNGAASLTATDLKLLDDLYPIVTPKHEPGDPTAFTNQVQAAAEHLLAVVDGKPKEVFGASYSQIKEVIGKIHESGYLDQALDAPYVEPEEIVENEVIIAVNDLMLPQPGPQEVIPSLETLTVERNPDTSPVPPLEPQLPPPEPQQLFYQQPPRPISEVLGTGSFFFLQDSELDTPDTLPSQTFTNTSYVQGPPPPIPLPPNFQPYQQPNNLVVAPSGNGVEEPSQPQVSQADEGVQKHRGPPRPSNNQNYYQNNNYNRPRPHRNGPRPANRHNQ